MVHRLRCSVASGIFPDQGSHPCLLYWQEDSLPLNCQVKSYYLYRKEEIEFQSVSITCLCQEVKRCL